MKLPSNMLMRTVALLLGAFILLQLMIVAVTSLPTRGDDRRPYGLPAPAEVAAMVGAIERSPAGQRADLVAAFDKGLYSVRISDAGVQASSNETTDDLVQLGRFYAAALSGHAVAVDAKRPVLGALFGSRPRPARLFAPVTIAISLDDGRALVLNSQPSRAIRKYLSRRSAIGAMGGLVLLIALLLAMGQIMRPIGALARGVRRFGTGQDAPDLPLAGPREVRDLAQAFNDMKGRINALMAERTRTLAAIAHDMRTYLTRLRLRAEYIDDAEMRARATRDLDEMATLLDDTLLLARTDAAADGPAAAIDLTALLRTAVAARDDVDTRIAVDLPPAPVMVPARPLAVRRMVDNLLDNGLRHGQLVMLALTAREGQAILSVADDGPGVAPEQLNRLGEPFHRGDPSRNRDSGGAGLGLAIVRALASRDGAQLGFENQPEGGLRATLRYPLA